MFKVTVKYGSGDRKAATVSDPLIIDIPMATVRGEQELAKHLNVSKSRDLKVPHEPTLNVGDIPNWSFAKLGIWGPHLVTKITIGIANGAVFDQVTAEQYEILER